MRLILLLGFFVLTTSVSEGTTISGAVRGTLTLSGSPYHVVGDLFVPQGDSLEIEPGVVLLFNAGVSFVVQGYLYVKGTAVDSVVFTAYDTTAGLEWSGIYMNQADSASVIRFARILHASVGITVVGTKGEIRYSYFGHNLTAIDCKGGATTVILGNLFEYNKNAAIRVNQSDPVIRGNFFFYNSQSEVESVLVFNTQSGGRVIRNIFAWNRMSAIDCSGQSAPRIWHNTIVGNYYGITAQESRVELISNVISNNSQGGVVMDGDTSSVIRHNDVYGNGGMDFYGTPVGVGWWVGVNAAGDSCDQFFNFSANPLFEDPASGNFKPLPGSPLVDTGDPSNPAGEPFLGFAPDVGAIETQYALPVELSAFRFADGWLEWITESETNNYGFAVWRSAFPTMKDRERIGFVPGKGTSTKRQVYRFRDPDPLPGTNYYQLEQIDLDGTVTWSRVLAVEYGNLPSEPFLVKAVFPNPAKDQLAITFELRDAAPFSAEVFDLLGRHVATLQSMQQAEPGTHTIQWNLTDAKGARIPSGVYFLVLTVQNRVVRQKLMVVR
jgi:parallel beta-helix repeat protein